MGADYSNCAKLRGFDAEKGKSTLIRLGQHARFSFFLRHLSVITLGLAPMGNIFCARACF
jgi:hypothetical protein